jgi:hypothetical protein
MDHLFSSVVKVQRLTKTRVDGVTQMTWVDQPSPLNAIRCRLDLNFLRPGKDIPPAQEAGTVPDRIGVMFCRPNNALRAGDRIVTVSGPVSGVFDLKVIPDIAVAYSAAHHIEVQIVESVQSLEPPRAWPE